MFHLPILKLLQRAWYAWVGNAVFQQPAFAAGPVLSSNINAEFERNAGWLRERWQREQSAASASSNAVPWRHKRASANWRRPLLEAGFDRPAGPLTRGQVDDILGLQKPPQLDQLRCLAFLGLDHEQYSLTECEEKLAVMFRDPIVQLNWRCRKPDALHETAFMFFGIDGEMPATAAEADQILEAYLRKRASAVRRYEWETFRLILERVLQYYYCTRQPAPSYQKLAVACQKLVEVGLTWADLHEDLSLLIGEF